MTTRTANRPAYCPSYKSIPASRVSYFHTVEALGLILDITRDTTHTTLTFDGGVTRRVRNNRTIRVLDTPFIIPC